MKVLRLRSAGGDLEAAFAPDAGLVGCSLTHRGQELLGQRKGLEEYARSGATFGIPFLHPWANRLAGYAYAVGGHEVELDAESSLVRREEHGLPIHGLRPSALRWEAEADGDALRATTEFDAERLEGFPYPHKLAVAASLDDAGLTIETVLTPASATPVPIAFGYHPYLRLPGAAREDWHVEVPIHEQLRLDAQMLPTGERVDAEVFAGRLGARTFDDAFVAPADASPFVLAGDGRRIELAFLAGYPYAQVFAPSEDDVIAFEPMTAPTNALVDGGAELPLLAPGASYEAVFAITLAEARLTRSG